jgi:hypothetical protein
MIATKRFISISMPRQMVQESSGWPSRRLLDSGTAHAGHKRELSSSNSSTPTAAGGCSSAPQCRHTSSPRSRSSRRGAPQLLHPATTRLSTSVAVGHTTCRLGVFAAQRLERGHRRGRSQIGLDRRRSVYSSEVGCPPESFCLRCCSTRIADVVSGSHSPVTVSEMATSGLALSWWPTGTRL